MLTPAQYAQLTPESQRTYLLALNPQDLLAFTAALNKWLCKSAKDADMLALFGSHPTTSNVRFNAQMLKRSKDDTLVDVCAQYPQLKACPAFMELVQEDFNRFLRPRR